MAVDLDWKFCINILLLGGLIYFIATSLKGINESLSSESFSNLDQKKSVDQPKADVKEDRRKDDFRADGPGTDGPGTDGPGTDGPRPVQEAMHDNVSIIDGKQVKKKQEEFDILKFVEEPEQNYDNIFYLNGTADDVKQYNVYTNNWNTANFKSNVLDLRHFYKRNPPPQSMIHPDAEIKNVNETKICFSNSDRNSTENPDVWKYKNEIPMNGGQFLTGVYGVDALDGLYATYNNQNIHGSDILKKTPGQCPYPDDIRNGLGTPGRKQNASR